MYSLFVDAGLDVFLLGSCLSAGGGVKLFLSIVWYMSIRMIMKKISIVTPCFNEEANVNEVYTQVRSAFQTLSQFEYEHIFIDNASTDRTVEYVKEIAVRDPRVKLIVNARNFGHIRSPYYALLQATGDAGMILAADLQEPPHLIPNFIEKWEQGYRIVVGQKTQSEESGLYFFLRGFYYRLVRKMADVDLVYQFTGFGLYDRKVLDVLKGLQEPYPYFRGMICEVGFERSVIQYHQPARKKGITKNNIYTLYDMAMLGFVNHSKIPLRLATFTGFLMGALSLVVAISYFLYKILFWDRFAVGSAPLVIGLFFFSSIQLIFIGILGEYIGAIYTQVKNRPLVVEKERVNFQ